MLTGILPVHSMMETEITPLILTFNEAPNIGRTLERLFWAKRIVVIDSFSTDATCDLVRQVPQATLIQRPFDSFARQCNFGLEQITTPWVLSLDADYVLSPELVPEIRNLRPPPEVSGYRARFRYCIHGRPLRSSLYPPRTVLYRRERAHYHDEGHGHRVGIEGPVLALEGCIDHDDRKPLDRWLTEQNRYMRIEAQHLLTSPRTELNLQDRIRRQVILAPFLVCFYTLLRRGLILDGWPGWYYVFQRTLAESMLSLRLLEAKLGIGEKQG